MAQATETVNVYFVLSEVLRAKVPCVEYLPGCTDGPIEEYRICELVAATTAARARWLAWKRDRDSFTGDIRDMPKMSVRLRRRDVDAPAGIVTDEGRFQDLWED